MCPIVSAPLVERVYYTGIHSLHAFPFEGLDMDIFDKMYILRRAVHNSPPKVEFLFDFSIKNFYEHV